MKNRLPGICTSVHDQAITVLADIELLSQLASNDYQVPKQRLVFRRDAVEGCNVAVGDEQQVNRRSRLLVTKGSDLFITIYDVCGYLASGNAAKDAVFGHF